MARPIKRLQAAPTVVQELRRRSRSTTISVRERERAAFCFGWMALAWKLPPRA